MKVKDINSTETIQDLQDRGFYLYNGEKIGVLRGTSYWCWFGGRKRNGNESPTIIIDSVTGIVAMKFSTNYFMKAIPDVLLFMIQRGKVEESDVR